MDYPQPAPTLQTPQPVVPKRGGLSKRTLFIGVGLVVVFLAGIIIVGKTMFKSVNNAQSPGNSVVAGDRGRIHFGTGPTLQAAVNENQITGGGIDRHNGTVTFAQDSLVILEYRGAYAYQVRALEQPAGVGFLQKDREGWVPIAWFIKEKAATTNLNIAATTNQALTNGSNQNVNITAVTNNTTTPSNTNVVAVAPVTSTATVNNYNIQIWRVTQVQTILHELKTSAGAPKSLADVQAAITSCARGTVPTGLTSAICATVNSASRKGNIILEDVYTGQPFDYTAVNSGYTMTFTIRYYDGMSTEDKRLIADGKNAATAYKVFSGVLDTINTRTTLDHTNAAFCYVKNNPSVVDGVPDNALRAQLTTDAAAFTAAFCTQALTNTTNVATYVTTDADTDGVPLLFEEIYGISDANKDTDNDGHADLQEILSGYNPNGPGHLEKAV